MFGDAPSMSINVDQKIPRVNEFMSTNKSVETRYRIHDPGHPWHGELATYVDMAGDSVLLELDRLPVNWRSRQAWFGVQQVRRVPQGEGR